MQHFYVSRCESYFDLSLTLMRLGDQNDAFNARQEMEGKKRKNYPRKCLEKPLKRPMQICVNDNQNACSKESRILLGF